MKAAFVVFDRLTSLDFIGFYDPVTRLCARARHVVDDRGLRIEADAVAEPLGGYDLLFVPGGFCTRSLQHDATFIAWLTPVSFGTSDRFVHERVVDEGDTITAGGVSSALDAGLHLVQRLAGPRCTRPSRGSDGLSVSLERLVAAQRAISQAVLRTSIS